MSEARSEYGTEKNPNKDKQVIDLLKSYTDDWYLKFCPTSPGIHRDIYFNIKRQIDSILNNAIRDLEEIK